MATGTSVSLSASRVQSPDGEVQHRRKAHPQEIRHEQDARGRETRQDVLSVAAMRRPRAQGSRRTPGPASEAEEDSRPADVERELDGEQLQGGSGSGTAPAPDEPSGHKPSSRTGGSRPAQKTQLGGFHDGLASAVYNLPRETMVNSEPRPRGQEAYQVKTDPGPGPATPDFVARCRGSRPFLFQNFGVRRLVET